MECFPSARPARPPCASASDLRRVVGDALFRKDEGGAGGRAYVRRGEDRAGRIRPKGRRASRGTRVVASERRPRLPQHQGGGAAVGYPKAQVSARHDACRQVRRRGARPRGQDSGGGRGLSYRRDNGALLGEPFAKGRDAARCGYAGTPGARPFARRPRDVHGRRRVACKGNCRWEEPLRRGDCTRDEGAERSGDSRGDLRIRRSGLRDRLRSYARDRLLPHHRRQGEGRPERRTHIPVPRPARTRRRDDPFPREDARRRDGRSGAGVRKRRDAPFRRTRRGACRA